jgi:hypothetical protein
VHLSPPGTASGAGQGARGCAWPAQCRIPGYSRFPPAARVTRDGQGWHRLADHIDERGPCQPEHRRAPSDRTRHPTLPSTPRDADPHIANCITVLSNSCYIPMCD